MDTNEIIDEVSLGIYQQDIVLESNSVFGERLRSRSNIYSLSNYLSEDIIDSSFTREQIYLLNLVDTDQIFDIKTCNSEIIAKMPKNHRLPFKNYLKHKIYCKHLKTNDFIRDLEFYYFIRL